MNAHPPQPPTSPDQGVDQLIGDVERFEAIVVGWDASQQAVAFAFRRAVDALNREALRKLIAAVKDASARSTPCEGLHPIRWCMRCCAITA